MGRTTAADEIVSLDSALGSFHSGKTLLRPVGYCLLMPSPTSDWTTSEDAPDPGSPFKPDAIAIRPWPAGVTLPLLQAIGS